MPLAEVCALCRFRKEFLVFKNDDILHVRDRIILPSPNGIIT